MNNPEPQDLVGLLIALFSVFAGREMAALLAPYAAIAVVAFGGAMVALTGTEKALTHMQALRYLAVRIVLAFALTVSVAEALQLFWPALKPRYTLIPVAFFIGYIKDYKAAIDWLIDLLKNLVNRKANNA